jgi:hypothetical protein
MLRMQEAADIQTINICLYAKAEHKKELPSQKNEVRAFYLEITEIISFSS